MLKINKTYFDNRGVKILITGIEMCDKYWIGMEQTKAGFIRQYGNNGQCIIGRNGFLNRDATLNLKNYLREE